MFYHPKGEDWYLNDRKQNIDQNMREGWYSSEGKQYGNYQQRVNRFSGEGKQHGNYQQRENWSVNGGNPWNYFRSGVQRRGNNWV